MKIAFISAGTGDAFYCENCVRDHSLISGLKENGHDVTMIPMYLPLQNEEDAEISAPIFFGAVRFYLSAKFSFFKKIPQSLLGFLDHTTILKLAASRAGSTRAGGHEAMTVGMLQGQQGPYSYEFDKMTDWLLKNVKPDLVFVSNAFLLGAASAIKAKKNVPVICLFQDEHTWVDAGDPSFRSVIWNTIAEKLKHVDISLTHTRWYAQKICDILKLETGRIKVVHFGVDPNRYRQSRPNNCSISIGYMGRVCRSLGMHTLTDAYCRLKRETGLQSISLDFCGGFTGDDLKVVKTSKKKVSYVNGSIRFHDGFGHSDRTKFLSTLSAFSLPSREKLTLGTSVIEALAAGVPVVQPDEGGFSEIVEDTGGGLLYSPNSPEALADALSQVINDKVRRNDLGKAGRDAIVERFNHINMARNALELLD